MARCSGVGVYYPGVTPRNHRTESVDYAIVLSGEIDIGMGGEGMVHLRVGDVLVQRGTIHNWINNGTEPCTVARVLIAAKPVERAGKMLVQPASVAACKPFIRGSAAVTTRLSTIA